MRIIRYLFISDNIALTNKHLKQKKICRGVGVWYMVDINENEMTNFFSMTNVANVIFNHNTY